MKLLVPLVLIASINPVGAATWDEAREKGSTVLEVHAELAQPFSYKDSSGRLVGFEVDLMRAFATWLETEHGVRTTLDWKTDNGWDDMYATVRDGTDGQFGVSQVSITSERRKELDFSPPYLANRVVLVTVGDETTFDDWDEAHEQLKGRDAITWKGTIQERLLLDMKSDLTELRIVREDGERVLERLANSKGRLFGFLDLTHFWAARTRFPQLVRHAALDRPGAAFGVIVPAESSWKPLLAQFLDPQRGFATTPAYQRLLREYFGWELAAVLKIMANESS